MDDGEELPKVHFEEEKCIAENNAKKRLKTPFQIEALQSFYNEHKYPLESMKLQLAQKIGLTEKQISGWFCHRRTKDKILLKNEACENGRLDRSSGVIQDSSGSTKPGHGQKSHFIGNQNAIDDTSSDSNSALHEVFISQCEIPSKIESLRFPTQNCAIGPKGYLKLKGGNSEHAAIIEVKRQLGGHYRRDGPPLGVEFEHLPPGAFETLVRGIDNEPYDVNDPMLSHPREMSGFRKQHIGSTTLDLYNSKISCRDSLLDHETNGTHCGPNARNKYHHQSNHMSPFRGYYSNSLNTNRSNALRSKHGVNEHIMNDQTDPYLYKNDHFNPTIIKRRDSSSVRSDGESSRRMGVSKNVGDEYTQRGYVARFSNPKTASWNKQIGRSVGEMSCSFNEDEFVQTIE